MSWTATSRPVGIITDRDLVVSAMAEGINPGRMTVEEIMTKELVTVDEEADLFEMLQHPFREFHQEAPRNTRDISS